jgi:hypothetical protein
MALWVNSQNQPSTKFVQDALVDTKILLDEFKLFSSESLWFTVTTTSSRYSFP